MLKPLGRDAATCSPCREGARTENVRLHPLASLSSLSLAKPSWKPEARGAHWLPRVGPGQGGWERGRDEQKKNDRPGWQTACSGYPAHIPLTGLRPFSAEVPLAQWEPLDWEAMRPPSPKTWADD